MKFLGDRLPFCSGRAAMDDERRHISAPEVFGQGGLGLQELRKNDCATFAARERLDQSAFALPTRLEGRLLAPGTRCGEVRELFQSLAPSCRAAARRLQQKPAPQAALAGAELRQTSSKFGLPLLPECMFLLIRFEQDSLGPARWQVDARVGSRVADHDLSKQPAQFLWLARLARPFRVNKSDAEFLRARQLTWLQQGDEVI